MASIEWSGVFPALLTPFDKHENPDFDMFRINMEAQVEAGVDGVILGGSLGEASTLLNEEKKQLLIYFLLSRKKRMGNLLPLEKF